MFILVDIKTQKIVGTALKPVSTDSCLKNGQMVYEIPDDKFKMEMIGSKLKLNDNLGK